MKHIIPAIAACALMGSAAHAVSAEEATKGEAKLAKMIEGRTAGKPTSCIPARVDSRLQIIDRTAIVYDGGKTIYVARPSDPKSLDTQDILIINRFGSQLCSQDVIRTVDRMSGFTTGVVFLGDFVPYEKP